MSFRDPKDQALSFLRFMEGWFLEPGTVSPDEAVQIQLIDGDHDDPSSYWTHVASWLSQQTNPDVLLLTFEDMKRNLHGAVSEIAQFLGLARPDRVEAAVHNSTYEFMSSHSGPFTEPLMRAWVEEHIGIPGDGDASKVRRGRAGDGQRQLALTTIEQVHELWRTHVGDTFGFPTYEDLVAELQVEPTSVLEPRVSSSPPIEPQTSQ